MKPRLEDYVETYYTIVFYVHVRHEQFYECNNVQMYYEILKKQSSDNSHEKIFQMFANNHYLIVIMFLNSESTGYAKSFEVNAIPFLYKNIILKVEYSKQNN